MSDKIAPSQYVIHCTCVQSDDKKRKCWLTSDLLQSFAWALIKERSYEAHAGMQMSLYLATLEL